jgi:hypothetical protein
MTTTDELRITAAAAYKNANIVTGVWDQLYTNRAFVTLHTAQILFIFKIINCKLEICTIIMSLYHICGFVYFRVIIFKIRTSF